jgi:nucleoside-diphosphate-sugar epimerase
MDNLLIIGGAGYIGRVLINRLNKSDFKIYCFDSLIYSQEKPKNSENFHFIQGDITNKNDFKKIREKKFDYIILLAGLVGDPITKKFPQLSKEINIKGVKNAINYYYKSAAKKLIFVSTCSNYGIVNKKNLANEKHKLNPKSIYAKQKVEIEKFLIKRKNLKKPYVILRFATAFGFSPRMRYDLTINEFLRDLITEKKLTVYDSDTFRPYCDIQDFAKVINLVIKNNDKQILNQIFNVGSNKNNFSKKKIVKSILKFFSNKNIEIKYLNKSVDPRNYKVDFTKINRYFNINFTSFKTSLNRTFREILNHTKKYKNKKKFGNYIIKKN